jgi:hypothetical protein
MLAIEVTINILPLIATIFLAAAAGFLMRSSQLKASHRKILELEREMLSNHAEILELQKEKADLTRQMRQPNIPVIAMKGVKEDLEVLEQKTRRAK